MNKEEIKEQSERFAKAMNCQENCDECDKSIEECLLDTRICLNLLLKIKYKNIKKKKQILKDSNSMVI